MNDVVFVADGGPGVGSGHLSRCAALAAALQDAGVPSTLVRPERAEGTTWDERFRKVVAVPSLSGTALQHKVEGAGAIVVDGMGLADALGSAVRPGVLRVAVDDGPPRPVVADLILNPNLTATASGYEPAEGGEVLAGPRWALLGPAYRRPPTTARLQPHARRLLVTCGAADPAGLTERFIDGLALLEPRLETTVVIGPFNPRRDAIIQRCAELDLGTAVAPPDLRAAAEVADMALTSLGTTATELAYLGVPNLAAAVDERQLPYLGAYEGLGFVSSLGWYADLTPERVARTVADLAGDPDRRRAMQQAGMTTVDGQGAARVATTLAHALRTRSS